MSGSEVVIVGGGVTGLSAGWWLARSGVKVTVLDKFIVGWEASGRNGGGASHYSSPLFDEEQRLWPQMDELLGYPTEHQKGRILIAMTERQWEQYRFIAERHTRLNHPVELLDVKQVQEAVPLAGDNCFGGVHYKFGGHANPQRTVQAYAWALQDLGGKIIQHSPVTGFETAGGKVTAVKTANATYGCDAVVVAAGPQIPQLMAQLGVDVPLAAARAEMIITEPAPMMPLGGVDGHKIYGRQTLRGNLAYGGGPHEWLDVDADWPGRAALHAAGPQPCETVGRTLAQGRASQCHPQLGWRHRKFARWPSNHRPPHQPRQCRGRFDVERRLWPVASIGSCDPRSGDRRQMLLCRYRSSQAVAL